MLINGQEYAWGDVQIILPGNNTRPVDGISEFEYGTKQDKPNIWGRGFEPVSRGRGKKESTGKIKLLQSEFEALVEAITGSNDPLSIPPFPITVSYAPEGGVIRTDKLLGCEFIEWKKGMKSGDPNMEIELPLVIAQIKLNA